MATIPIKSPRRIDPSLIEKGDDVSVTFKPNRGLTITQRGIVAKRVDSGATRYLMTEDGATILAWDPKGKSGATAILHGREEHPQTMLWSDSEELGERVA